MRKVRLGLIGLGYAGRIHLRSCLKLQTAKLAAVSDTSKKTLVFAKRMGVKDTFTDYEKLLQDRSIDAVIIALPTHLHAACAKKVVEAEKDILLEKPLARNVAEGKDIVSTAMRNGVKLMVGYPLRFSSFRRLKEEMQSGMLGDVQIACVTLIGSGPFFHRVESHIPLPVPSWWFKRELTGGGALMDLGSHVINLARWYFGEITDIKSYLGYRFNMDLEDHATCIAKFASGTIANINVGWFSGENHVKVDLFGTVKHALDSLTPPQYGLIATVKLLATKFSKSDLPFLKELEHFVHCIRHDLPPSPSGNDALKDLEAIASAYKNEIRLK